VKRKQAYLVAPCCIAAALLAGYQSLSGKEKTISEVGPSKTYRIVVPKEGFIGAPSSPAAVPNIRKPNRLEDFKTFVVRVTVVAEREHKGGQRKVMRIDQIDPKGNLLLEGVYYSYVDTLPDGTRIIPRYKDDDEDVGETGVAHGIPFPFTCARPPGPRKKVHDGYVDYRVGLGVKSEEISSVVWIQATRFETAATGERTIRWYKSDIDHVVNDAKSKVRYSEKQKWVNAGSDWLWEEMERRDKRGNILMRCTRVQ